MSQIPRRTSEFQVGSAKRSLSNKQQPSRSTLVRQPSSVGISGGGGNNNARSSSIAFGRVSATPMRTPARTPNRSSSKDRGTIVPMTAEKEKAPVDDREYLCTVTNFILEDLSKIEIFKELTHKGLKSMTLKNFIMILRHYIQYICNVPNDFMTNYIDFVYNLLIQLEYPYNINKSSLKTPNAPHCFNNIIVLLGWLAEFSKCDDEDVQYKTTEELPDNQIIQKLMNSTKHAYSLFNEAKSTDDIENKIMNFYLESQVGPCSDVESEIKRLKFEIEQLQKDIKPVSLSNELKEKQELSDQLNDQIKLRNGNINVLNRKIANLRADYALRREAEEHSAHELQTLQFKLKNQQMSVENRQDLLIEITQLKSALASKRNATMELSESSAEREIVLSNIISKKFSLIDRLNNLLYKLSSDLEIVGEKISFDPADFQIQSTKNDQQMNEMINQMHQGLKALKEQCLHIFSISKEKIINMEAEVHSYKTQNDLYEIQVQKIKSEFEKLEEEEFAIENEVISLVQNIQSNYKDRIDKIETSKKEILERNKGLVAYEQKIKELTEERIELGKKVVVECNQLYEQRKEEIENRRNELRRTIKTIDNYERNKQPLPDNLQKILDQVIKRKNK
ncbi:hypothetical protein PVAND_007023 [Polypedilum vanderplanki]|uniref:Kinetochore protein NDC80 n=1 Tax=Polypedilum vanderplanki TaxID=319348 RepID=A0A9J6C5Z4_POLVA|nr:hypothetical protein PVAND_007023 [Polypedilum vanderplanki]